MGDAQHSQYFPLISAGLGFVSAFVLLSLKEYLDRRAKRREAAAILLFHLTILRRYIVDRAPPAARVLATFDEALRRMAAARMRFYEWEEVETLNEINAEFASGQLAAMTHLDSRVHRLDAAIKTLKGRLNPYL